MEKTPGPQQNLEGALCYLLGWITGVIFFIVEPKNKFIRFHAVQSIALFIILTVVYIVLAFVHISWIISTLLSIIIVILWLLLMFKAYQGQMFKLPLVGNLAEQQASRVVGA